MCLVAFRRNNDSEVNRRRWPAKVQDDNGHAGDVRKPSALHKILCARSRQDDRANARRDARAYAAAKCASAPLAGRTFDRYASLPHPIVENETTRAKRKPSATHDYSMSYPKPSDQTAAVVAALAELGVRPDDRVLIMLPDGPGFAEAFAGTVQQGAVPLPVNPLLPVHGIVAAAAEAGASLVLATADQIHALADLDSEPPVLVNGPQGLWAAALRLH
ncbi:MAG: AMP-binding protein [Pseudonocardiaceae bacterium]